MTPREHLAGMIAAALIAGNKTGDLRAVPYTAVAQADALLATLMWTLPGSTVPKDFTDALLATLTRTLPGSTVPEDLPDA